jgi:DNA-binding PucR family transcriptional regulator
MGRRPAFDPARLDVRTWVLGTSAVSLAIGEPGTGIDGFCRTHAEAEHARRVALLGRSRPGVVTRYADVELLAIATIDLERTRMFVDRALGRLADDDDVARRLAATLSIYLQENRSRTRTAKRLGIHENTVTYRIRQAEGVLEHSVESDALELAMALALLPSVR